MSCLNRASMGLVSMAALLLTVGTARVHSAPGGTSLPRLKVSDNKRFVVTEDGRPYFYFADTAWELFHRLNREDAAKYLDNRAERNYTAIQAVVLAERNGIRSPNACGDKPLISDNDPSRPLMTKGKDPASAGQYDFWDHVDYIVDAARKYPAPGSK